MPFSPDTAVGTVAEQFPGTSQAFRRFGIEPCCDGGLRLAEVCRERQVAYGDLLSALTDALAPAPARTTWSSRPATDLTAHLVEAFHEPLRQELPGLHQMALRLQAHADSHQRALAVTLQELKRLTDGLETSMELEERDMFPLIARFERAQLHAGDPAHFAYLRSTLETAHAEARQSLRLLGKITDEYRPPAHACSTQRTLYHGLDELERLMRLHIHLEDHVLFPRAATMTFEAGTERIP
jgi:regulator of cell morphogenesis and NO signaling